MNRLMRRALFAALLATTSLAAVTAVVEPSFAADAEERDIRREVRNLYADAVEAFQDDMDFPAAHGFLAEARAIADLNPDEIYTIEILDFQLYLQEQNFEAAAPRFNAAYDSGELTDADKENFLRAATIINQTDYPRAIEYGNQAKNYPTWDDGGDQVLANAYFYTEDYATAVEFTQSVIARKEAAGQPVPLPILAVLQGSQIELGDEAGAQETTIKIATADPTPERWNTVVDFSFAAPNLEDRHYLNLYRLRREAGVMQAADYTGLAQVALDSGLPAESKSALDEGIAKGVLQPSDLTDALGTVDTLTVETEASLPEFAAEAAAAPNGQAQVQYGELLLSYGRAAEAEAAIQAGIQKGGLENPADAQIVLGIAQLEQGKKAEAQQSFTQAEQDPIASPIARVWKAYASI